MMSGTLLPVRMRGTFVCSVLKSWPVTLTVMLGYFAVNSVPSFWNSGTSIDASSTLIVTLALPTAVLAGCEGGALLDAAPGAQAVTSAAHATDKPVTAVNVVRRRERVDGRSMAVPFSFVGSGMANAACAN